MSVTLEIKGLKELKRDMAKLDVDLQKKVLDSATQAAAAEYRKIYLSNLGGKYDRFKPAVLVRKRRTRKRRRTETKYSIGIAHGKNSINDFWMWHIVEWGAEPHDIKPRTAEALQLAHNLFIKGTIKHPGVRPTRAATRAFNQKQRIVRAMIVRARKRFGKLSKKT